MKKGIGLSAIVLIIITVLVFLKRIINGIRMELKKLRAHYANLCQMLYLKQTNDDAARLFFEKNGYKRVAIYGMGYVGSLLYNELNDLGINVEYGIDQGGKYIESDLKIHSPGDRLPNVDVIVVSVEHVYDEVKTNLKNETKADVVKLRDVLFYSE